ncbi:MAG: hypothetical protein HRU11_02375, partial [Parvularculaceae bacterium]|nr:hypothetical protein [Parvularculaceae bacterium]
MTRAVFQLIPVLLALLASAQSAPITSNTFETFNRQTFRGLPEAFTGGPRSVGIDDDEVTFTSSNPRAVFAYTAAYGLSDNGSWGGGRRGFIGLNVAFGWLRFDFAQPVSGVGAFVNYAPPATSFGTATLTVLGLDDTVLDTFVLNQDAPISTPDAVDAGAFRGFNRKRGDIHAFVISDGFSVLDNLTWSRDNVAPEVVPVPSAIWLFALPLALALRRSHASVMAQPPRHPVTGLVLADPR